ncbi:hypothetical protein HC928_02740 [bacterium]|nr:hypothetical protein [bacterium]
MDNRILILLGGIATFFCSYLRGESSLETSFFYEKHFEGDYRYEIWGNQFSYTLHHPTGFDIKGNYRCNYRIHKFQESNLKLAYGFNHGPFTLFPAGFLEFLGHKVKHFETRDVYINRISSGIGMGIRLNFLDMAYTMGEVDYVHDLLHSVISINHFKFWGKTKEKLRKRARFVFQTGTKINNSLDVTVKGHLEKRGKHYFTRGFSVNFNWKI